ncbi:MAG: cell envelope integrity protein TolA [Pseudomonadota bacterium]
MSTALVYDGSAAAQSLLLHGVIGVLLVFGLRWTSETIEPKFPNAIQAVVVDTSAMREAQQQRKEAAQQKLRDQAAERRRQEQARQAEAQAEAERKRVEQEKVRQQQADRQRADDLRQQRLAQERERNEALARKQAALKAEREKLAAEREKQQRDLAEIQAQREADALAREKAIEDARRQQLLDIENQQRQAQQDLTKMEEWVGLIAALVRQNWRKPPTARSGERCRVNVSQLPGGDVISATVAPGCNVDEVTKRSIVDAVLRSEPLPYQGFERVFRRQLTFEFVVD